MTYGNQRGVAFDLQQSLQLPCINSVTSIVERTAHHQVVSVLCKMDATGDIFGKSACWCFGSTTLTMFGCQIRNLTRRCRLCNIRPFRWAVVELKQQCFRATLCSSATSSSSCPSSAFAEVQALRQAMKILKATPGTSHSSFTASGLQRGSCAFVFSGFQASTHFCNRIPPGSTHRYRRTNDKYRALLSESFMSYSRSHVDFADL